MSEVAILGSGPAGLFAALAAEQSGHNPVIFAEGKKSEMFGAMYLHRAIPGLSFPDIPDFEITIIKTGNQEGYAYNVYGDRQAPCSWEKFSDGIQPAWDLKRHYDELWDRYHGIIKSTNVNRSNLGAICNNYPLVLCSIPAMSLCERGHIFKNQEIWVVHGEGTHLVHGVNDDNLMYYNGVPWDGSFPCSEWDGLHDDGTGKGATYMRGHEWYRFSQINRYQAWEYSRKPEWAWIGTNPEDDELGRQLSEGIKPLWNSCGCWMDYPNFHRIGRFGTWTKGVLTHHAYEQSLEVCRALQ